ncbi:MAG: nucleotide exchange factor GrpE [Ardenticatenaceae bacterium]|nr:nucleotide exchange factor GrpE [Anaerolineales bacterium]MCB8920990.1 nucleotide exchange factor GrpE [Ardenticatenaceae bacterium]MCB8991586.1 nucleotide exchange factor GrpE [Ardenticatenaceae bacterium]MCB9004215.1 nucleotide exchange factor GrpE [Ardenticatenaceae bacterium]
MSNETIKDQVEEVETNEVKEVVEETAVPTDTAETEPTLEEQLEAAKAEAAKNMDGWLRAQAEFANARKRFEKQRADAYNNATADVIVNLLPVMDDFQRALDNVPETIEKDGWFEGIVLVQRKLNTVLDNFKVVPIEAVGQPFDPNLHEAIMQEDSDEYESGIVTRELQKGYKLGDRVVRPTLVYVAA